MFCRAIFCGLLSFSLIGCGESAEDIFGFRKPALKVNLYSPAVLGTWKGPADWAAYYSASTGFIDLEYQKDSYPFEIQDERYSIVALCNSTIYWFRLHADDPSEIVLDCEAEYPHKVERWLLIHDRPQNLSEYASRDGIVQVGTIKASIEDKLHHRDVIVAASHEGPFDILHLKEEHGSLAPLVKVLRRQKLKESTHLDFPQSGYQALVPLPLQGLEARDQAQARWHTRGDTSLALKIYKDEQVVAFGPSPDYGSLGTNSIFALAEDTARYGSIIISI